MSIAILQNHTKNFLYVPNPRVLPNGNFQTEILDMWLQYSIMYIHLERRDYADSNEKDS